MASSTSVEWTVEIDDAPVWVDSSHGGCAVVGAEGAVVVVDSATGGIEARTEVVGGLLHAALSPSGGAVALSGPFGAWLWSLEDGTMTDVGGGSWSSVSRWVNGERLALAAGRTVRVVDAGGAPLWRSHEFASTVTDVAWLGGRSRIGVAAYGGVHVVEPRPRGTTTTMPFTGSLLALAASPNGRWIVSGNQDATLQVFRTDKDDRLEMEGYPSKISRVGFDGSGRYLANDGAPEVTVWDFSGPGPRGRAPVLLVAPGDPGASMVGCFAWHPHRPELAVGWSSGAVCLYDVGRGVKGRPMSATVVLDHEGSAVTAMAWVDDGSSVIVARENGVVALRRADRDVPE